MKWYNGIMFVLTVTCVSIVLLALTGCANTADVKTAKIEADYRKEVLKMKKGSERDKKLLETVEERSYEIEVLRCERYMKKVDPGTPNEHLEFDIDSCHVEKAQQVHATPIEMPQEWLDQWPSTRQVNEQIENSVIEVHQ